MLSRVGLKHWHKLASLPTSQSIAKRFFAEEAGTVERDGIKPKQLPQPPEGDMPEYFSFTLSCPHKELFTDAPVRAVGIPGAVGRFAVTPGHVPVICELQSGILSIYHEKSEQAGRQDHYFVSGGMCLVHPNAQLEISCPEACLLSDIDPKNLKDGLQKAMDKKAKASDEKEQFQCDIEIETYEQIERALSAPNM